MPRKGANLPSSIPAAGCICYNPERPHVLLISHALLQGQFSFPKGKSRERETTVETATRETFEETGVDVSDCMSEELFLAYKRKKRAKVEVTLFHVLNLPMEAKELTSPSPLEIAAVRWVPVEWIGVRLDQRTATLWDRVAAFVAERRRDD
jgi:8-oxo-dGTP pyrophosphatase MutT (NUDIX family)